MNRPGPIRVLLLMAFAVAAGACASGTSAIDGSHVERALVREAHRTYAGVAIERARCPRRIKTRPGLQFACTVDVGGAALRVRVTRDDRNGKLAFRALAAVVTKPTLEAFVQTHLSLPAAVDCGPSPVQVIDPGGQVDCQVAYVDGSKQAVRLRIADVLGNASIETPS